MPIMLKLCVHNWHIVKKCLHKIPIIFLHEKYGTDQFNYDNKIGFQYRFMIRTTTGNNKIKIVTSLELCIKDSIAFILPASLFPLTLHLAIFGCSN